MAIHMNLIEEDTSPSPLPWSPHSSEVEGFPDVAFWTRRVAAFALSNAHD